MVQEGIALGHKISLNGIEVDMARVEIIEKLPPLTNVKGLRNFLGHARYYHQFIRDFFKISKSLSNLLMKDVPFDFSNNCLQDFETLKKKPVSASIMIAPDWGLSFEIMCDASDFSLGIVLG